METPSSRIIGAASATQSVADAEGRQLQVRRMGALDKLRLFKAVGAHLAQNPPYLGMAMLACSVMAIDGVPVPAPANEQQVEALVSRLGDVGIAAVAAVLEPDADSSAEADTLGN